VTQTSAAAGPKMRAVVVTIRTTIQPGNKTLDHTITIANGRARNGDELDKWRLFDFANDRVTFVDDISKTFRTVPMETLVHDHLDALHATLPPNVPRAELESTNETKSIQGVNAKESVVKLGGYVHQMWIGVHPAIPQKLFAMMLASRTPSSPFEPAMKEVDEELMKISGFPLAEHAELPFGNKTMTVDKSVVSIDQRDVPLSLLNVPGDYKDLTPPAPNTPPRRGGISDGSTVK